MSHYKVVPDPETLRKCWCHEEVNPHWQNQPRAQLRCDRDHPQPVLGPRRASSWQALPKPEASLAKASGHARGADGTHVFPGRRQRLSDGPERQPAVLAAAESSAAFVALLPQAPKKPPSSFEVAPRRKPEAPDGPSARKRTGTSSTSSAGSAGSGRSGELHGSGARSRALASGAFEREGSRVQGSRV